MVTYSATPVRLSPTLLHPYGRFGKAVNSKESKGHASMSKVGTKGANKQA